MNSILNAVVFILWVVAVLATIPVCICWFVCITLPACLWAAFADEWTTPRWTEPEYPMHWTMCIQGLAPLHRRS